MCVVMLIAITIILIADIGGLRLLSKVIVRIFSIFKIEIYTTNLVTKYIMGISVRLCGLMIRDKASRLCGHINARTGGFFAIQSLSNVLRS